MKRYLAAAAATGMVTVLGFGSVASAATVQTGSIVLDNTNVSAPHKIVYNSTTYMPIWYVMRALNALDIQSVWDGHEWQLTAPSSAKVDLSNIHPGMGSTSIYLNGILIQKVSGIVAVDPASGQKTTYMPIWYVMQILNRVGISSNWNGSQWNMESPAVQELANAFTNSQKAPYSQLTGDIHEVLQVQPIISPQTGNTSSSSSTTSTSLPSQTTIDMKVQSQSGMVNNQKAMLVTITPTITPTPGSTSSSGQTSGNGSAALPSIIQEYIQGSQVWINQGQGWQASPQSAALLQQIESQMPGSQINLAALKDIQSTPTASGYTYTAQLNPIAMEALLGPMMQSVASQTAASSNLSPSQMQAILTTILSRMMGSVTIQVQTVSGLPFITAEQSQISIDLPMSQLSSIMGNSTNSTLSKISDVKVNETVSASYTYNDVPLTPPSGLPQN